jgi:DDE superfamily endonuclease
MGKHKTTGMNVLVACTLEGRLSWISGPAPGSRHDNYIVKDSSVLDSVDPLDYIGDKGFVGNGMITPFRNQQEENFWTQCHLEELVRAGLSWMRAPDLGDCA